MTANGMPPDGSADKTLGEIVTEVSEKASLLVREEIELAKAEVTDKLTKLTRGAVIAVAAGVFAVFGITMFFHGLAWFLDDVFNWEDNIWAGFAVVTVLLFLLALLAAFIAYRLFKKGAPPTPDLAIQEAKATRAELEAQKIERDQVKRSLEREHAVRASDPNSRRGGEGVVPRSRSPEMIRASIEETRHELAFSVNDLRSKVAEVTNWRGQLIRNRRTALIGAAVAGFVIGGGIAAGVSLITGRR